MNVVDFIRKIELHTGNVEGILKVRENRFIPFAIQDVVDRGDDVILMAYVLSDVDIDKMAVDYAKMYIRWTDLEEYTIAQLIERAYKDGFINGRSS